MKKTSIYLEPDLDTELARIARGDGVTKAEQIRLTLRHAVGRPQPQITATASTASQGAEPPLKTRRSPKPPAEYEPADPRRLPRRPSRCRSRRTCATKSLVVVRAEILRCATVPLALAEFDFLAASREGLRGCAKHSGET